MRGTNIFLAFALILQISSALADESSAVVEDVVTEDNSKLSERLNGGDIGGIVSSMLCIFLIGGGFHVGRLERLFWLVCIGFFAGLAVYFVNEGKVIKQLIF